MIMVCFECCFLQHFASALWQVNVNLQPLAFTISENFTMLSFSEKDSGSILQNTSWEHFVPQFVARNFWKKNLFHLFFFWQGSGVGLDEKRNEGELCDTNVCKYCIYIYICKHRNRWYFLDLEPWTACFTLFSFPHFLRWIWTKSARWSFTRNAPWRRRPRASVCHPPVAVVFGSPSTGHVWHGDAPCVRWRMRRHRNPVPWSMVGWEFRIWVTFTCWPLWICL